MIKASFVQNSKPLSHLLQFLHVFAGLRYLYFSPPNIANVAPGLTNRHIPEVKEKRIINHSGTEGFGTHTKHQGGRSKWTRPVSQE